MLHTQQIQTQRGRRKEKKKNTSTHGGTEHKIIKIRKPRKREASPCARRPLRYFSFRVATIEHAFSPLVLSLSLGSFCLLWMRCLFWVVGISGAKIYRNGFCLPNTNIVGKLHIIEPWAAFKRFLTIITLNAITYMEEWTFKSLFKQCTPHHLYRVCTRTIFRFLRQRLVNRFGHVNILIERFVP